MCLTRITNISPHDFARTFRQAASRGHHQEYLQTFLDQNRRIFESKGVGLKAGQRSRALRSEGAQASASDSRNFLAALRSPVSNPSVNWA
jgi:hypothetical protein